MTAYRTLQILLFALLLTDLANAQNSEAAEPGQLLSREQHATLSREQVDAEVQGRFANDGEAAPAAVADVEVHLITFSSTGADGGTATGSAQLFLPTGPVDPALLVFAPGSTGLVGSCGPLQELLASGSVDTYGASALAFAGQGFPTVLPDYLYNLGPDGMQPYMVATAEAAVLIDALRAAGEALDQLDGPPIRMNFMAGYSQGGHAVLAAADRVGIYAPDLPVGGVIGYGPSGDVGVLFEYFHYTAPWVVWAYQNTYPAAGLEADQVLAGRFAGELERAARTLCIAEAQAQYPVAAEDLYTDEFWTALVSGTLPTDFPAWAEAFRDNDTSVNGHGIPVLIHQGVNDEVVPLEAQQDQVRKLCAGGSSVRFANYLRTRHETRYLGFAESLSWLRDRLQGESAPNDCKEQSG